MKKLIINADDFGYSRAINYGIMDCFQYGVLSSATFMANMPGAEHAADLAKQNPGLGVGVHLVLTCGEPILENHKTIVDVSGKFRKLAFYESAFNIELDEVYNEWKAQIERFLSYGLKPTHLDSHHHINTYKGIRDIFCQLAAEYNLPVRKNMELPSNLKHPDQFEYYVEQILSDESSLMGAFQEADTVEVMCHPGYLDKAVVGGSSYTYPRLDELELLMSDRVEQVLKNCKDVKLTTFESL
ncbi:polysaccharide deacetylase [Terribacillus saccharophilus]|uniref:Polysaccharide deacetylase n=1 Tax=Terribacillus saccharophilus TaxID=361277 RepID=A0A075LGN4_9BACI|nr:chitin disaccharide deacetylase [Terribacillus goriensis]AIF65810.1 polysaccharide deacetylase [Terribacillus goriensis]